MKYVLSTRWTNKDLIELEERDKTKENDTYAYYEKFGFTYILHKNLQTVYVAQYNILGDKKFTLPKQYKVSRKLGKLEEPFGINTLSRRGYGSFKALTDGVGTRQYLYRSSDVVEFSSTDQAIEIAKRIIDEGLRDNEVFVQGR